MKSILIITTVCLLSLTCVGQLRNPVDPAAYRLAKTITQNHARFRFWEGSVPKTQYEVVVERRFKGKQNFYAMRPAMNGEYTLKDKNGDGFLDFVTNYHGYDIVYLFNPAANRFTEKQAYIAEETGIVDKKRKVYWSYRAAQYGDRRSFSVLYRFHGGSLINLYKIVYVTKEDYSDNVIRLDLYRIKGTHEQFMRTLNVKRPNDFRSSQYWKTNYQTLLGYR